ncbi:hypothetical protein LCGC14_2117060, partial [marine sediment metagenome]
FAYAAAADVAVAMATPDQRAILYYSGGLSKLLPAGVAESVLRSKTRLEEEMVRDAQQEIRGEMQRFMHGVELGKGGNFHCSRYERLHASRWAFRLATFVGERSTPTPFFVFPTPEILFDNTCLPQCQRAEFVRQQVATAKAADCIGTSSSFRYTSVT